MNPLNSTVVSRTISRTISLSWKTDKVTGVKKDSVSVDVPVLDVSILSAVAFTPFLLEYMNSIQDKLARTLIEKGIKEAVIPTLLGATEMLEFLTAENESGRITKEKAISWFDAELADLLTVSLADKLGLSDTPDDAQVMKLNKLIVIYKDKICGLAGGKTSYAPKVAAQLYDAISLSDLEDKNGIGHKFSLRLQKMSIQDEDLINLL